MLFRSAVTCVTVTSHDLLLCSHCTVVPGGAHPTANLGPLKGGPLSLQASAVLRVRCMIHAEMLGQAMIQRDQLELLLAAVAGAGLGGVAGLVLGHEELGTLVWALVGAVLVSGVVYLHRFFRRR